MLKKTTKKKNKPWAALCVDELFRVILWDYLQSMFVCLFFLDPFWWMPCYKLDYEYLFSVEQLGLLKLVILIYIHINIL